MGCFSCIEQWRSSIIGHLHSVVLSVFLYAIEYNSIVVYFIALLPHRFDNVKLK